MTRKDIELLFKSESYNEAMELLRKELQDDSENAEWFYYLFLAENGDYANINLNDIECEFNFNRALDLANTRLRDSFNAEYNFYKAVDPTLRKYFSYASRDNIDKFEFLLNSHGYYATALIHDGSNTKDFFSNLDYLVTSRVKPEIIDLNLLAINILYLATNNNKVLDSYNVLKERAEEIGTTLSKTKLADSLYELKEYMQALKNNKRITSEDKEEEAKRKKLEELAKSLELESNRIAMEKANLNQRQEEAKIAEDALKNRYDELKEKENSIKSQEQGMNAYYNNNSNNIRFDTTNTTNTKVAYFKYLGMPLKGICITNFVFMFIFCICRMATFVSNVNGIFFQGGCTILFIFALIHMIFAIIGMTRSTRRENGSIPALVFSIVSITFYAIIEYIILLYNVGTSYY